jgi:uroporphyrinogen decarboxylase
LAHESPDRVPVDYYARSEVSAAFVKALGLASEEALIERLGVDLRGVGPGFRPWSDPLAYADPTVRVADGVYYDIWGVGFRPNQTAAGFYMDLAHGPLQRLSSISELDDYPWPTADLWDYSTLCAQAEAHAAHWVWAHSRGIFEISWFMRGFNEFMEDLVLAPDRATALMDRIQEYLMERTRRILEAGAGRIDMVEYNDDVGGQNGLLISPAMWRAFIKPRMAAFVRLCKAYGAAIRFHSCGGVRPIIPDLIEIGVDVLNPVQTIAAGMEPAGLKRDFGDRICFNGGIDTQYLLPRASRSEVARETETIIRTLGRNGGYILGPSHVFQGDVPIENIRAVYETALGRPL